MLLVSDPTRLIPRLEDKFLLDVQAEVERARKLYPSNKHMLAALFEEIGEAAQALIDHDVKAIASDGSPKATPEDIYKELVQSAAMCLRVAIDADPSFGYRGPAS